MGLDEPGVAHDMTQQTELERVFPLQAGVDGFLNVDFPPEQEGAISFQADVAVNPEITTALNATRQEFVEPPKIRQQREMTTKGTE